MKHLLHFFRDFKLTGAIAPSSRFLARGMVRELRKLTETGTPPPLDILELGAGTGPMTGEIIKHMRPADRLDVVEIQRRFYELVRAKYREDNIHYYHSDIVEFEPGRSYDFIFSSLPYESMPAEIGHKIWQKKLDICKPGGCIIYFKYVNPSPFQSDFEREVVNRHLAHRKTVLLNLPPAWVYTLRPETGDGSLPAEESGAQM